MPWLDVILVALLVAGAIFGARSGLLRQLARLVGFGVALYTTVYFHEPVVAFLKTNVMTQTDNEPLISVVGYVMVFCVIYLSIFFGTLLIEQGVHAMKLEALNRLLGAGLGAGLVGLLVGFVFLLTASYPDPATKEWLSKSMLGPWLATSVEKALIALPEEYGKDLRDGLESLKAAIKSRAEGGKESAK